MKELAGFLPSFLASVAYSQVLEYPAFLCIPPPNPNIHSLGSRSMKSGMLENEEEHHFLDKNSH